MTDDYWQAITQAVAEEAARARGEERIDPTLTVPWTFYMKSMTLRVHGQPYQVLLGSWVTRRGSVSKLHAFDVPDFADYPLMSMCGREAPPDHARTKLHVDRCSPDLHIGRFSNCDRCGMDVSIVQRYMPRVECVPTDCLLCRDNLRERYDERQRVEVHRRQAEYYRMAMGPRPDVSIIKGYV